MPVINPAAVNQRNAIAQALMNVRRPPPVTQIPRPPMPSPMGMAGPMAGAGLRPPMGAPATAPMPVGYGGAPTGAPMMPTGAPPMMPTGAPPMNAPPMTAAPVGAPPPMARPVPRY